MKLIGPAKPTEGASIISELRHLLFKYKCLNQTLKQILSRECRKKKEITEKVKKALTLTCAVGHPQLVEAEKLLREALDIDRRPKP